MLNKQLTHLKTHFGIFNLSDWQHVQPAWILAQDGCGPKTLDYLRVLLANHGLTLKDDRTPEFWKLHYRDAKILEQLTDDEDGQDRGVICPFVIFIDTAEQMPLSFQGMRCDADQQHRPLIVPTERKCLGRHPLALGDYTIDCGEGRCHVERKSVDDLTGTLLGWNDGRRDRFECELSNLNRLCEALVIVEGSYPDFLKAAPATTTRQPQENAKILHRSVRSLMRRFRGVQWHFAGSKRLAETFVFDWFRGFHEDQQEERKRESKALRKIQQPVSTASVASEAVASLF
jgi:hypothetical protein